MVDLPLDRLKQLVAAHFPQAVTYRRARPLRRGEGKLRRFIPRVMGVSQDNLFSFEALHPGGRVREVQFMSLASDAGILARNMAALKGVLDGVYQPEYADWEWLVVAVGEFRAEKQGSVAVKPMEMGAVRVVFVNIT